MTAGSRRKGGGVVDDWVGVPGELGGGLVAAEGDSKMEEEARSPRSRSGCWAAFDLWGLRLRNSSEKGSMGSA